MEYAGAEEHRLLPLGARAAAYSYAKLIMDGVILLSVTSCLNSALYTASRMLYSLSRRGDAPAIMGRTNRSKTPYVAVLLSTSAAVPHRSGELLCPRQGV